MRYKNNNLYIENLSIELLAKKYGTPLYIYSKKALVSEYTNIKKALKGIESQIHYAVKANTNTKISKILHQQGCSFDVDSLGELLVAKKAGAPSNNIVYTGPGKTNEELESAIKLGVLYIAIESLQEAEAIIKISRRLKKKVGVSIRINPATSFKTHTHLTTGGKEHKFGVDEKGLLNIFNAIRKSNYVYLIGINTHIGSQVKSGVMRKNMFKLMINMANTLNKAGADIKFIDSGGGLPFDYASDRKFDAKKYFAPSVKLFKNSQYVFVIEPGRRLVAGTGHLVTRVIYTKKHYNNHFTIVDAAMNDFIRPSLYGATHKIIAAKKTSRKIKTTLAGPVCESGDFFVKNKLLPKMSPGDLCVIKDTGAYGMVMSSNYNMRPRPAEILVDGNKTSLIRKREEYKDII